MCNHCDYFSQAYAVSDSFFISKLLEIIKEKKMKKVNFEFINDKGQTKKGYVWLDDLTYKMIWKLEEVDRIGYLSDEIRLLCLRSAIWL